MLHWKTSSKALYIIIIKDVLYMNISNEEKILQELTNLLENTSLRDATKSISEKYQINKNVVYKMALEIKDAHKA